MDLNEKILIESKKREVGRFPYFFFLLFNVFKKQYGEINIEFTLFNKVIDAKHFESELTLIKYFKGLIPNAEPNSQSFLSLAGEAEYCPTITVFFPKVVIKNPNIANTTGHLMRNIFFKIKFSKSYLNAYLFRNLLSNVEYNSKYMHSHANTNQFSYYSTYCLGNGPISNTCREMSRSLFSDRNFTAEDIDNFILIASKFALEFGELLAYESDDGIAYTRYTVLYQYLNNEYIRNNLSRYENSQVDMSVLSHTLKKDNIYQTVLDNCEIKTTKKKGEILSIKLIPDLIQLSDALLNLGIDYNNSSTPVYLDINDVTNEFAYFKNSYNRNVNRGRVITDDLYLDTEISFNNIPLRLRVINNNKYFSNDATPVNNLIRVHNIDYLFSLVSFINQYINVRLQHNENLELNKKLKNK